MQIKANWKKPIELRNGRNENLIYQISFDEIPYYGGCYAFYNKWGNSITILYIGKADNIHRRVEQQFNNLKLMMGIKNAINGNKFLMFCQIQGKNGTMGYKKNVKKLERQLIKYATLEGHDLLNQKGTKIKYQQIHFKGNRDSEYMFGRKMNISK
ncbi:MAG: GIY-YIG nuclease family protein [Bacteroidota bacterium]|nr:GIY-YIG nuclease family protein [Bacteroidota bacterium]